MSKWRVSCSLNPRDHMFVWYYIQSWDAKAAAKKAGYPPWTVAHIKQTILNKPKVKREVKRVMDSIAEEAGIKGVDILKRVDRLARLNEAASPVLTEKMGTETPVNSADALKAHKMLGDHLGLFTPPDTKNESGYDNMIKEINLDE